MPTAPATPNGRATLPVARPWDTPIIEYSAVDAVPIMLGGVERHLLYSNRALKEIARATDKNPFDAQQWGELMRDPDGISVVLRAGLLHEDPNLTVEQVDEWVLLPRVSYYIERLWYAWRDAMPDPEPAEATAAADGGDSDPNGVSAPTG